MRLRALAILLLVAAVEAPAFATPPPAPVATTTHAAPVAAPSAPTPLYKNLYIGKPSVTAHVVVRSGEDGRMGRIVVADPRGNTGTGFWPEKFPAGTVGLHVENDLREVSSNGVHGVSTTLSGPPEMRIKKYFLGNVRELRDAEQNAEGHRTTLLKDASSTLASWGKQADPKTEEIRQTMMKRLDHWLQPERVIDPSRPGTVILQRQALGSGATYKTEFVPEGGTKIEMDGNDLVFKGDGRTTFKMRTFIDRPGLAPLARVFKESSPGERGHMGKALRFLASGEKLLAGSWQYLTYFGRDTMISAALLANHAAPEFMSMAVGSVLDRVSPDGIPAHEEDIGDQATLRNLGPLLQRIRAQGGVKLTEADLTALEKPVYDTKMIDGEFLLPQLVDRMVNNTEPNDAALSAAFRPDRLAALGRVLGRIDMLTAKPPGRGSFIAFNEGELVGDWRDSHEGNGLGHVPLDVSAYLVPAALESIASLSLNPKFPKAALLAAAGPNRARLEKLLDPKALQTRRDAWRKSTGEAFEVTLDRPTAQKRLGAALATLDKDEAEAFGNQHLFGSTTTLKDALKPGSTALGKGVRFSGIALDAQNKPIPVQSSDAVFDFFYGTPDREELLGHAQTVFQPYPLGLMTPVGVATSNYAFSDRPQDRDLFGKGKYHGSKVVWGWQQPMLKQGLEKQLVRFKNDPEVTKVLNEAMGLVVAAERSVGNVGKKAEAWAWKTIDGKIAAVPYGADAGDATEANDRQLWTVAGSLGAQPSR